MDKFKTAKRCNDRKAGVVSSICPALYDDIIIYGKEDFDVSIHCTKTTKENVLYSKEWHEERTELTYNDFENETFKGIKCIETGQLFDTVG